jgi:sulfite reductase (NADPH) hemoprotein beta-component
MSKAPPLPAILMANDLLSGDVVFLGPLHWEMSYRQALVAHTSSEAEALLARASVAFKANHIVDPYLVHVTVTADREPVPVHYREKMRTLGPTTRLDLGKQAEA